MAHILLIDDIDVVRRALSATLEKAGHTIVSVADGQSGLAKGISENFDLIITDIMMPDYDGTDVVFALKSQKPTQKIIAISGGGAGITAAEALKLALVRSDAILTKPIENDLLLNTIEDVLAA